MEEHLIIVVVDPGVGQAQDLVESPGGCNGFELGRNSGGGEVGEDGAAASKLKGAQEVDGERVHRSGHDACNATGLGEGGSRRG